MSMKTALAAVVIGTLAIAGIGFAQVAGTIDPSIGSQKLIQEIDCSQENKDILFLEYPKGVSKVQAIIGTACRVLPNDAGNQKFMAYRVGEGKGLKPGASYMLHVDYPDDRARTMMIMNWGCETALGFASGQSLGDALKGKYVANNPESLKYPVSGKMQIWSQFFQLHDRFPEIKRPRGLGPRPLTPQDGFWVIFAQLPPYQDPMGAGTAVSKIRLYEVQDPSAVSVKINLPPEGLPRRHIFSREEMADAAVAMGHKPEEKDEKVRGVKVPGDWYEYKMRQMQFLGIDTFTKDLLEFGHNQGWDATEGSGDAWYHAASTPHLWDEILERAAKLKLNVLPYYEYRGSIGADPSVALGSQHRARRLDGGETYTHITWCEGNNVDIADPDTLADAKKLLDVTLVKYKGQVNMIGAWFRQRPTAMPVSFNDKDLAMFTAEANGGTRIARSHLQTDKELLEKYYSWWFGKRKAFFDGVRDHLREKVGPQAFVLYTNDASEPGRPLPRSITGAGKPNGWEWAQVVVNDDVAAWEQILNDQTNYNMVKSFPFEEVVDKDIHLRGLQTFAENWDQWEMNHAAPPDDPASYRDDNGVMLSYTYNRLYTVGSPRPFDAYRTRAGLTLMRHYSLNENEMSVGNDELLGYFMCDMERSGPYCMMAEARAMAYGDPTNLGSLVGNSNRRGFPQYVRNFNQAFLALPALPSEVVANASSDPEVIVRAIKTQSNGTYYSIVNIGFGEKKGVVVTLPAGVVTDAATNEAVQADGGKVKLDLYPAQLRALQLQ